MFLEITKKLWAFPLLFGKNTVQFNLYYYVYLIEVYKVLAVGLKNIFCLQRTAG